MVAEKPCGGLRPYGFNRNARKVAVRFGQTARLGASPAAADPLPPALFGETRPAMRPLVGRRAISRLTQSGLLCVFAQTPAPPPVAVSPRLRFIRPRSLSQPPFPLSLTTVA